ncbi:Zinc finger, C2H2 type [Porphyromonas cangingivalis]|uniref:C2H2-type zinc finger protein n=1 Tax=Porphyromonas cangingivalis TaxID=36874 RepID=UPI000D8D38B4|nr:C2H2-type zinc finger protein [Porphyromonas cangingivalis]SPY34980.1 Zinc finger, C2H2 type [Porphyromonas cangingivalis]
MANTNQISLKVCGNPDANSGFQPMVIFNSPSIEIKDTVYAGFDANSYFFTIKIEKNQVVYKLIKNNVSSLGASRQGCLVIGIAIPKGYKLDNGISPYDVLMELKNGFLALCMTCKDAVTEKYEFSSNRVQPNILDSIAGKFTLISAHMPYRTMSANAPIAYVTATEDKIKQLMNDVQYPAFSKFSEIVVAESVQSTSYYPITNITIPRMPEYSIYDDGVLQTTIVTDPKQLLTFNGKGNPKFYENDSLMFTLEELLNGENVPNVSIDRANESINVSTKALQKPLIRKINVVIVPKEAETFFLRTKDEWKLIYRDHPITLKEDLSFDLIGEQLKIIDAPQSLRIQQSHKDQYEAKMISVSPYEIRITAEKVHRAGSVSGGKPATSGALQPSNLNACEVQLLLNHAYHRSHCSVQFYNNNDDLLLSTTALFSRSPDGKYLAKVYVPKSWSGTDVHVCLKYKNEHWYSINNIGRDVNGIIELHDKDFTYKKIGFFSKYSRGIVIAILMLLSLLVGGAIGYFGKSYFDLSDKKSEPLSCNICLQKFTDQNELESHISKVHNNQDPSTNEGVADQKITCPECGQNFSNESDLDAHKTSHDKTVRCDKSKEAFATETEMSTHKSAAHPTTTQTFRCDECNSEFPSLSSLQKHKNKVHSPKECKYCQQQFKDQEALKAHLKEKHHFVCNECGPNVYFATQKELEAHKRRRRKDGRPHDR